MCHIVPVEQINLKYYYCYWISPNLGWPKGGGMDRYGADIHHVCRNAHGRDEVIPGSGQHR